MEKQLRRCSAALFLMAVIMLSMWLPGTSATVKAAASVMPKIAGSASGRLISVKWIAPANSEAVELYMKDTGGYKKVGTYLKRQNINQVLLTGKYSTAYVFKVRALVRENGKLDYTYLATVVVKTAPNPTNTRNTKREKLNSGLVSWEKDLTVDGYEIYRSTSKYGKYQKIATIANRNVSAVRDNTLKSSGTYYYRVRAYSKNSYNNVYGCLGSIAELDKYTAPVTQTAKSRKLLIVGDSRVLYMQNWFPNSKVKYIAKSGEGISWLSSSTIQNQILSSLDGNTDVVVWIGTNDYDYIYSKYIPFYQSVVPRWKAKGARTFFVTLGQFKGGADGWGGYDSNLRTFNAGLKSLAASTGARFIDVYSYLAKTGYSYLSGDRVHFSQATTQTVLKYILSAAGI